jgi:hypothetical protein
MFFYIFFINSQDYKKKYFKNINYIKNNLKRTLKSKRHGHQFTLVFCPGKYDVYLLLNRKIFCAGNIFSM